MRRARAAWIAAVVLVSLGLASPVAAQTQSSPPAPGQAGHTHPPPETQPQKSDPTHPITEADRAAAFPDVKGHAVHDRAIHAFVLFDQLEWQAGGGAQGASWDTKGWIGGDIHRLSFRTEGEGRDGRLGEAEAHVLYSRAVARWWELVGGLRQEFRPGPARTWAAFGIQGLAPYWFEVEATGYVGESGRTAARLEAEYELLVTNRLVVQPLVEVDLVGKSDPERGIGAGLSTLDAGLRLRYEIRRELAPYVGVTWGWKLGETADFARRSGEEVAGARLAVGLRTWF